MARTESGQVIDLGTTNADGTTVLVAPAGVMLLDIPEAGVFGLPLRSGGHLRILPQG